MATILIMEDEAHLAEAWAETLKAAGHMVLVCVNGSEAVATAVATPIDLLIADIFVRRGEQPVADGGVLLIGRLRSLAHDKTTPWLRDLPIIAVSGVGAINRLGDPLQFALQVGADETLAKPFSTDSLKEKVEQLLARRA